MHCSIGKKWALGAQVYSGSTISETIKLGNRRVPSFTHSCSESECMTIPIDMHNVGDLHWNLVGWLECGAMKRDCFWFFPLSPTAQWFPMSQSECKLSRSDRKSPLNKLYQFFAMVRRAKNVVVFLLPAPETTAPSNQSTCHQDRCTAFYWCQILNFECRKPHHANFYLNWMFTKSQQWLWFKC